MTMNKLGKAKATMHRYVQTMVEAVNPTSSHAQRLELPYSKPSEISSLLIRLEMRSL